MKRLRLTFVCLLAFSSYAVARQTVSAKPQPYQRQFNTIAHQFLDWESQASKIDDAKYKFVDEVIASTIKQVPEQLRSSAMSDRSSALQVFQIVENALANHNVVYNGWTDTLGDALAPHHVTSGQLMQIEFYNPTPSRQAAIKANSSGVFYFMDCKTSAVMYLAVAELLKIPVFLVDIPGHFFVRWSAGGKSLNWDTNLATEFSDSEYSARAHIPDDLISGKIYLSNMDRNQVFGTWHGLVGDRFATLGNCQKAVYEHRKAVELYSKSITEENNLAWVLSTCSDGQYRNATEAVQIASKVVEIWPEPNFVDTLAAAYAEEHDWEKAVSTEEKAKALGRPEIHSEFDKPWPDFDRYIAAYKQHKTYLESTTESGVSSSSDAQPQMSTTLLRSHPSESVREYLTTLQRLYTNKPALSTPEQRETFCRQWKWLMSALAVSALAGGPETGKGLDIEKLTDCSNAFQRLDEVRQTPYSNPEYDWMGRNVQERVAVAVQELGFSLKYSPTIGTLPVGLLNAKIISVPGAEDTLIIVNDEVFRLPYGISKTVVQAVDFKIVDQHYVHILADADQIKNYVGSHPDIVRNFQFVVLQYLHLAAHVLDEPIPLDTQLGQVISQLYYGLADAVEVFIVSHEYAHLVLEHAYQRQQALALPGNHTSTVSVDEKVYSWKQELEADAYGFLIMDTVLKQDAVRRSGSWKADPSYPFFVSAPSFFFLSMELVECSKDILETGHVKPPLTQEDIKLAERAIDQLFEDKSIQSVHDAKQEHDEGSNSHPPFVVRFVEAKALADKAESLYFEDNKVPADTAQVYRLGKLFQDTLLVLYDLTEPSFEKMYQGTGTQQEKASTSKTATATSKERTKVAPNELSPTLVQEELKSRGVNVLDRSQAGAVTDDFVKYHFLAGDSTNLVSESPSALKAAQKLADSLGGTGLRSKVVVKTKTAGARIHYQLIGRNEDTPSARLTNDTEDEIPIGFYFIWADRQGHPTSPKVDIFRVVKPQIVIDIEETISAPQ
jgi:hypothetical protein